MENLVIPGTVDTPEINFDAGSGNLVLEGKSYPEDTAEVFTPVMEWLDVYIGNPSGSTSITFKLDYFNSSSYKSILTILMKLESIVDEGGSVNVNWTYRGKDRDMKEAGEEFAELVDLPFEFSEK